MELNLSRKLVWPKLIMVLLACYWVLVTGNLAGDNVVQKFDRAIGAYVSKTASEKMQALTKKMNESKSTCDAKIKGEYQRCEICLKLCGVTVTPKYLSKQLLHKIKPPINSILEDVVNGIKNTLSHTTKYVEDSLKNMLQPLKNPFPRIRLPTPRIRIPTPRIRIPTPRIRLPTPRIRLPRISYRAPRISFRAPRFSRGWGKKRGVQKAVRDMNCSCTMCDTFKNVSLTERTKRVCGSNFYSEKNKLLMEHNDLGKIKNFTDNQFVKKIFMELASLENINNTLYLTNSIITFSTPNGSEFNLKMTRGMPIGFESLNTTEIVSLEGPKVFALLRKNS